MTDNGGDALAQYVHLGQIHDRRRLKIAFLSDMPHMLFHLIRRDVIWCRRLGKRIVGDTAFRVQAAPIVNIGYNLALPFNLYDSV